MQIQKWLIVIGCIFILAGLFLPWLLKFGLGRLPGDILIKNEKVTFYFPIMTCVIISVIISFIVWLINK